MAHKDHPHLKVSDVMGLLRRLRPRGLQLLPDPASDRCVIIIRVRTRFRTSLGVHDISGGDQAITTGALLKLSPSGRTALAWMIFASLDRIGRTGFG